jgi:hypothetical protein
MAKSKGTFVVPRNFDHEGKRFATKVNESIAQLKGEIGNPLDSAVTFRDLIDAGIAKRDIRIGSNGNIIGGGTGDIVIGDEEVLDIPPAPTGVSADGAFQNIVIEWDVPTFFGFSHAEVWTSSTSNFADRVFVGQTTAAVFSHQVGNGQTRYYWIRFVNIQDTVGPFNSTTGTQASTAPDIAALMTELSETLQDLPGYSAITTLIDNSVTNIIRSTSSPSTRTDGSSLQPNDIWIDTDDNNQAYVRNASNNGWEKTRDSSLISLYNTLSSTVTTNSTNISTAQSDIITLTTDTTANASAITSLTSTVNSNTSAISSEATTRASADSSLATDITNLTSTVGGNSSSITTLSTTTADINDNLDAMYVIQASTESNGSVSVAGMVIGSNADSGNGAQSYVQFQADKFAVWNGSSNIAPFIVSGGSVFIKDAMIQNGAITNAKIGSLAVDDAKIANLAVTEAKIANAAIATAKIQDLAVDNAKIANLAVTNAKINDLSADKINAGFINADRIQANTITAAKINVTDLALEFDAATVSGSTLGYWMNNTMRLKKVADIGTDPGIYHIMCRVFGGTSQVKTLSIVAGDGTFGTLGNELRSDFTYNDQPICTNLSIQDQGYAQYNSSQSQYWSGVDRFQATTHMVQKDFIVRKISTTSRTLRLYILAQGDTNFAQLSNVQYGFYKFSEI